MRPGLIVALAVVCGCAAGLEANRVASRIHTSMRRLRCRP